MNDSIKRPGDFAGRYGGEEFCAVLPNTDLSGALRVAESIRTAVLRADEPNAGSAYGKLTVSVGAASHSGVAAADDTVQDLIHLADGRLYEAKAAGRNVVIPRQERPKLAVV
ncbi:diguanylate cyclase [Ralstonia chuxiongensis]